MVAPQAPAQKPRVGAGRGDDDYRRLTLFDPIHQGREHVELVGGGAVRALRHARHAKETREEKRVTPTPLGRDHLTFTATSGPAFGRHAPVVPSSLVTVTWSGDIKFDQKVCTTRCQRKICS